MKQSGLGACALGFFSLLFFQRAERLSTPASAMTSSSTAGYYGSELTGSFTMKEMLHFYDGTVAEHCTKQRRLPLSRFHEDPPVVNLGTYVVPASAHYVQSWQDINPAIRNVVFVYHKNKS